MAFDHLSGTDKKIEYMHIFFEMMDGNYIAFFDDPFNAPKDFFVDMNGFDSHIAVEVGSIEHLKAIESKLNSIGWDSFMIDHEFVTSLYIFDPNGIQLEFTCRARDHDKIMAEDASKAHQEIKDWSERTRALKVEKFGEKILIQKMTSSILTYKRIP